MRAAPGPESIREPEEVLLVDRVQQRDHRPLDDLVLQGSDRERALLTVRLGDVYAPGRQCPIRSPLDPLMQVRRDCGRGLPRSPATSVRSTPGARSAFQREERLPSSSTLTWWKSAVNLSFFLSLAAFRMRSSACDTLSRLCVRRVLCWPAFPLVPALRSTGSAAGLLRLCSPASSAVGSEEAPNEELASVRRTNRTYSFPVSGFHERAFAICSEGMSETRLTSLNSVRNRLVGYSFHAALRHRLVRCDHSRRIIQPSS